MTRLSAWRILRSGDPTPLRAVPRIAAARNMDGRDRAFLRRLLSTELRHRAALQLLAQRFTRGKPTPDLACHLRLGFAQLLFMQGVPDHAAVSETVDATTRSLGLSKGRIVNGVLRNTIRGRHEGASGNPKRDIPGGHWHLDQDIFPDPEQHPLLWAEAALGVPAPLYKRWVKRYGEDVARKLAEYALQDPPVSLRLCRGTWEQLEADLEGTEWTQGEHPAIRLVRGGELHALLEKEAFTSGALIVQGETALRAAEFVQAQPNERILDLCAAPGGKTMVLAAQGARVVASDLSAKRLGRIAENLARLDLKADLVASDGTQAFGDAEPFDAVLVDAPCSNTGVLAARPGARWRYGPKSQKDLTALQAKLLADGARLVRPGGRLVYSTCSLEPEENGRQVQSFLAEHPEFTLEESFEALPGQSEGGGGPVDGGFAARLRRH